MEISVFKRNTSTEKKSLALSHSARVALLATFGLLSGLIYWFFFHEQAYLFNLYKRSRLDVMWLYEGGVGRLAIFITGFALLAGLYYLAYRMALKVRPVYAWALVIAGTLAFGAILLFIYPFDSSDIFDNIVHGRMISVYNKNPFERTAFTIAKDTFVRYMGWPRALSAYGPVWEMLAALTARLAGNGIYENILAFKLLPGLFFFGSLGLSAAILRRQDPQKAPARLLLLAWNPVVLYETFGNGHNDIAMMFWIIAAAWALTRRRFTLAILALEMGMLFKYIPLLLIPAAGLIALRELPNARSRIRFTLVTGLISLALVVLAYLPFWHGLDTLTIDRRTKLYTSSLPATVYHLLIPELGKAEAAAQVSRTALALTLVVALFLAYQAYRDRSPESFARASFNTLAFYLLVTCLWFHQWYTLWLLALIPLLQPGSLRRLAVLFGFTALSKQFLIGPLLFWPSMRPIQPFLEMIFSLGTLGPAWWYAGRVFWRESRLVQALRERRLPDLAYVPVASEEARETYRGSGMD